MVEHTDSIVESKPLQRVSQLGEVSFSYLEHEKVLVDTIYLLINISSTSNKGHEL